MGRLDEAQDEVQAYRDAAKEGYAPEDYIKIDLPIYADPGTKDHWLEGYRKAGIAV